MPRTVLALALVLLGCASAGSASLSSALEAQGVDLGALFAPPIAAELEAVRADWARRELGARNVEVLLEEHIADGRTLRVLAHDVGPARHVGALIVPAEDAPVPEGGFPVTLSLSGFGPPFEITVAPEPQPEDAIPVVALLPAFRGHTMIVGERRFEATGPRFDQCDGGGDDALAFTNAALEVEARARRDALVAVGGSRGGNVALLLGARDPRMAAVASLAGPTRYLERAWLDHPNLGVLYDEWFVRGLLDATGTLAEARRRMIACSPAYFVADLPRVQ
ncbi:MAG: hypothetical protein AAGH15_24980, partial [Myxococcota bacterium]